MSLTVNMNTFVIKPLAAFKGEEIEANQFLARKIEKGTGKESKGVIIPALTNEQAMEMLLSSKVLEEAVTSYVQGLQEECIKKVIAADKSSVCIADFDLQAIESYLQEQEIKEGRITKERISAWFKAEAQESIYAAFKAKLGDALDNDRANELLKMYHAAFICFTKKDFSFSDTAYKNVQKALEIIPDSAIKQFCEKKLPDMKQKSADDWGL